MQILFAENCGFCFGVERALEKVEEVLKGEKNKEHLPIYTYGPIIHNSKVVERLQQRGVDILDNVDFIDKGIVIIRSHGIHPDLLKRAYEKGLVIIDATSETYFDSALDELATFGSRYARLVIVTQEGFSTDARLSTLKKYPLSHIVLVPGIKVQGTNIEVMSDYILPVIINIIGSALRYLDQ